jgi:hypothetical protein
MAATARAPAPTAPSRAVAPRALQDLAPHDELFALIGEPAEGDVEWLARTQAAGRDTGLMPEVTPDGRVIFGYEVVTAGRRAGLGKIDVILRADLDGQAPAVVRMALIDAALERGDLTPLGTARCIARAHQLRSAIPFESIRPYQRGVVDEQVALRLGVSLRTAQRYCRLVQTPAEVQAAFSSGKLPLTLAERAAGLSDARQAKLADALRGSKDACEVFARFVKVRGGRHAKTAAAWRALLKSLRRGLDDMDDRFQDVRALSPEDAAVVDIALRELEGVRKRAAVVTPQGQAAGLQALRDSMGQRRP